MKRPYIYYMWKGQYEPKLDPNKIGVEGTGIGLTFIATIIFWAVVIALVVLLSGCKTTTSNTYLQKNPVDERKTNIYTNGEQKGYLQESPVDSRRTNVYDNKGNQKGFYKRSPVDNRKVIFHKRR